MANEGDRKKSSRKKTSSKRIADAVEQAKQAAAAKPESEPPRETHKRAAQSEFPAAPPPAPEPPIEVRETTTVEEVETAQADALPLLQSEPELSAELPEESDADASLSERASCFIGDMRRLAAEYIDASEKFANRLLDIQCEAANMAEGTPLERVLRAQHALGQRIVESSARAARVLWRVDRGEEAAG